MTRAVLRRAYFSKVFEENKQIVLMKKKQAQHRIFCDEKIIPNDFDEEPDAVQDPSQGGTVVVA